MKRLLALLLVLFVLGCSAPEAASPEPVEQTEPAVSEPVETPAAEEVAEPPVSLETSDDVFDSIDDALAYI